MQLPASRRAFPLALLVLALALPARAEVAVGQPAPPFALQGSDGKLHRSADLAGKRGFVLAWFPKAFTPGCTAEVGSLRDAADAIAAYDVAVFLISTDEPERNADFAKSQDAKHPILSDPDGGVAAAYGVAGESSLFPKRTTFYVDKDGIVRAIDESVETGTAGADVAAKLGELGFPRR
jgi:peroxiredoxin Q/BCP